MSYTSAQSGDNYRNWWPHPTMTDFTNDSIDELDRLAAESDNVFQMTKGGYALATRRQDVADLVNSIPGNIDVRVFSGSDRKHFPALSPDIQNVIHIRRGGDISGQQLGQYMLQRIAAAGGKKQRAKLTAVHQGSAYSLTVRDSNGSRQINADILINAAGPFANSVAEMLGTTLPLSNIYQQKIAFEDQLASIPREMPFSIDLDTKTLDWNDEEREMLRDDSDLAWLTDEMPSGTHCRPDGGVNGRWVKLGWAYNQTPSVPQDELSNEVSIDPSFPEIVIRGTAKLIPALTPYIENPPGRFSHYGGYYTMTDENWPIIGPLDGRGAYVVGALSGFGSMAACAAGKLCAAHVCGGALPAYADNLSLRRYENTELMAELVALNNQGLL